jgi:hypothetical protein
VERHRPSQVAGLLRGAASLCLVLALCVVVAISPATAHADVVNPGITFTSDDLAELIRIADLLQSGGQAASHAEYMELIQLQRQAQQYVAFGGGDTVTISDAQTAINEVRYLFTNVPTAAPSAQVAESSSLWQTIKGVGVDATGVESSEAGALLELEGSAGMLATTAEGAAVFSPPGWIVGAGIATTFAMAIGVDKFMSIAVPAVDVPDHGHLTTTGWAYEPAPVREYVARYHFDGYGLTGDGFKAGAPADFAPYLAASGCFSTCGDYQLAQEEWDWFGQPGAVVSEPASYNDGSCYASSCYYRRTTAPLQQGVAIMPGVAPGGAYDPTHSPAWTSAPPTTTADPRWPNVQNKLDSLPGGPGVRGSSNHKDQPQIYPAPTAAEPNPAPILPGESWPTVSPWTMPDCVGLTVSQCEALVSPVAPPDADITTVPARTYVPTIAPGAVVATDPAGGASTQRKDVTIEVNPDPSADETFQLPQPQGFETYPQYLYRLRRMGWVGTSLLVTGTDTYLVGPGVVVTVTLDPPTTAPPGTIDPIPVPVWNPVPDPTTNPIPDPAPWPNPAPSVRPDQPITVTVSPPDAAPAPIPPPGGGPPPPPPGPGGSPPPPPPPPPPPTGQIDFTPLTNLDPGCKFPYGFICYAKDVTGWFNVTPEAPDFHIPVHVSAASVGVDWHGDYDVNLGAVGTDSGSLTSPASLNDYMAVMRLLESIAMWVGAVYLLATRLVGFKAGGDPGEAVDEALTW